MFQMMSREVQIKAHIQITMNETQLGYFEIPKWSNETESISNNCRFVR